MLPFNSSQILSIILLTLPTTAQNFVTTIIKTAVPTSAAASPQYTNLSELQTSVLNSTNTYRRQHNATALSWNTTLAAYAQSQVSACQFAHSYGPYGENLAQGYLNVTAAIEAWGDERHQYDFEDGGFSKKTGHFTQLVWKAATCTGCGVEDCGKSGWLIFCEYWPPGNVRGQFEDEVQQRIRSSEESRPSPSDSTPPESSSTESTSTRSPSSESTSTQTEAPKQGGLIDYVMYLHERINGAETLCTGSRTWLLGVYALAVWLLL